MKLAPLAQEMLLHPTFDSFLLHYFSGYGGRYWRFVHSSKGHDALPDYPREALITSYPWLYSSTYYMSHFLAEIDISGTQHGIDTRPGEGDLRLWLRVFDVRKVKIVQVYDVATGIIRAKRYHQSLPNNIVEMQHFYNATITTYGQGIVTASPT